MLRRAFLLVSLVAFCSFSALAQKDRADLSESEIEEIREAAIDPAARVQAFQKALETRITRLEDTLKKRPVPGRNQDIHDYMEQFTAIADELDDNLDDYSANHPDLRKVLPKLLTATERWATILRTPPDNSAYTVAKKLALEAVDDLQKSTKEMIEDQKEWFKTHEPPKKRDQAPEPYVVPR